MKKPSRGDTIVEVLIAIGIASFAISISYATANRSLQRAVTASERSQALNLLQNQLTDLQLRYKVDTANFSGKFDSSVNHFCLNDSVTDPSSSDWGPYLNYSNGTALQTNLTSAASPNASNPYYDKGDQQECHRVSSGVDYYIDIVTTLDSTVTGASNLPTDYQVIVRWAPLGGGQTNQSSIYYRL